MSSATAIARGQTSGPSNPVLKSTIVVGGVLRDVASLEYTISRRDSAGVLTQVFPSSGREIVNLGTSKVYTGQYAATWTVPSNAPVGDWEVQWYFRLVLLGTEYTYAQPFEVLSSMRVVGPMYATVQSMRDEGVPGSITDAVLQRKLVLASKQFEMYTQRSFLPVAKTVRLDGAGSSALLLDEPIVGIASVQMTSEFMILEDGYIQLEELRVYNRHLTQGLQDPDDRVSPRIEFASSYFPYGSEMRPSTGLRRWPLGNQNVIVSGVFGFTEPDGTPTGGVPEIVAGAVRLMALREMPALTDTEGRFDARDRWKLTSERTRDQAYTLFSGVDAAARSAMIGNYTGDPTIDMIIAQFRRPPRISAV